MPQDQDLTKTQRGGGGRSRGGRGARGDRGDRDRDRAPPPPRAPRREEYPRDGVRKVNPQTSIGIDRSDLLTLPPTGAVPSPQLRLQTRSYRIHREPSSEPAKHACDRRLDVRSNPVELTRPRPYSIDVMSPQTSTRMCSQAMAAHQHILIFPVANGFTTVSKMNDMVGICP